MKITSVSIYSGSTSIAEMSFRDPSSQNSYIAKAIVGLDADEITSRFYSLSSTQANDKYYSMSLGKRDIIINIHLNPTFSTGETVAVLRDNLYRAISASRTGTIQLRFNDGLTVVAYIDGHISKLESDLFAKSPEVKLTLSCGDPMFKAPSINTYDVVPLNESALPRVKPTITDNVSTAPHGFKFAVTMTGGMPYFMITDNPNPSGTYAPNWSFNVTPGVGSGPGFQASDQLFFSSEVGNRYLYMIRAGVTTHLVDKILANAVWPIIFPGINNFAIPNSGGFFTWDSITYRNTFWGI